MNHLQSDDFVKDTAIQIKDIAPEINHIISKAIFGLPKAASTFTIRFEYNPYTGQCEKIPPRDGLGTRALKYAIKERWNISDDQFEVYTKESDNDSIIYITFHCYNSDATFQLDVLHL